MRGKSLALGTAAVAALAMAATVAVADPPGHRGKGKKNKNRGGDADVVVHVDTGGPGVRHRGGPPPWAPAHGYRAKRNGHYDGGTSVAYLAPYGLDTGHCNRKELGTVLGAVGGAIIGSKVASKDDKVIGIVAGGVIGAVVGGAIGKRMDAVDQNCVGQALEHAPDGQSVGWQNPDYGGDYAVTPVKSYQSQAGQYCREYQTVSYVNGREVETYGTACRQPDGNWRTIS